MIQRAGYDLLRVGLRIAVQLWPLWLFWWAWDFANDQWVGLLQGFPGSQQTLVYALAYWAWPTAALLGPLVVMVAGVSLFRVTLGSRAMALAGVVGMAVTAVLTGWPEYQRLWPYVGAPGVSYFALLNAIYLPLLIAVILGGLAAIMGFYVTIRPQPIGRRQSPALLRGASDNFGHAAWLSMRDARKLFSGPDPAYGGIVVGEAYRVDEDPVARRLRFDPRDRRTWGRGGSQPLLVDPCRAGSTHALVLAGSGGFKTTSVGIPTLLAWTGSAVVLDPSQEVCPMLTAYRRQSLGHTVVTLDPATATVSGINVLDWIDITSPLADGHVDSVVNWITTESRETASDSAAFFKGSGT